MNEISILELKRKVCERLNFDYLEPDEIDDDEPLVSEKLYIDSIDVLEILVMIEEEYGVKIASREEGAVAFRSFRTLSEYIANHMPRK